MLGLKGLYPDEYMDCFERFVEDLLSVKDFFSIV